MDDDVDFPVLMLGTEKVTGGVKVEQVELVVGREGWRAGSAGEGQGDDGVAVGVEVLRCGSSEDAGCAWKRGECEYGDASWDAYL